MKLQAFTSILALLGASLAGNVAAASGMLQLNVTNTSSMPISGGVVYVTNGQGGASEVGQTPSAGFIALCQTGNSTTKFNELKGNSAVSYVMQTPGPFLPGTSISVAVPMPTSDAESVHFEAMYGDSKEACASISIPGSAIFAAAQSGELIGKDEVVVAGAATIPTVPAMATTVCNSATTAAACLRLLTMARTSGQQIGYFPGYLPSVLTYIESKYGAANAQALVIPTSGAAHFNLKLD